MMIPIVGHPQVVLVSERKAKKLLKKNKALFIDGILHWAQVPQRILPKHGAVVPRFVWFERNSRESLVKRWKTAMSAEHGEGGPLVRQAVTTEG
jgi:hypothetical protein